MKKVVRILLAILMVTCFALGITACKSECEKGNHDKYIKSTDAATCTAAKVEHWACHNCDDWTEDVTKGEPLGHDFDAWKPCTDNDAQHQRACKRDGCTVVEKADHEYVDGVCVCGKTEGTAPQPCTHPNKDGTNVTEATCTTAKVIHWTCPDCDWTEDETVGNPLGHDYVGQEWKVSGTTHYQECKRDGCNGRNSHTADMSAWAAVGSNHERHCNKDGCTISEEHAADFTDVAWTIADPDNHYKVCPTCGLHGEVAAHNHDKLTKINDNQHSVACSVCSKIFGNENHDWVLDEDKSEAPTCSKEGVNIYVCACGTEKNEPVEKLKHTPKFVITETHHKTVCEVCGETIIAETAHEIVWNNTDKDEHWQYCKICEYEVPNTHAPHSYKEGELVCEVCNRTPEGVIVATYYKGEYHRYDTLVEAVASITDSEEAVIYLGKNLEGAGIFIPENRNINFRLQGNTYTVVSGAVGSKNYESQGFHIEKDGNITIQNGTITSKAGSGVKMLVQNYANLTLMNNLVLDGSNLDADGSNPLYTLSNNYGETLIRNTTIIPKTERDVALDVWYGMSSAYYGGVKVTLGVSNTITGIIEYGSAVPVTDWSKVALVMRTNRNHSIRFSGNVPSCEVANITFEDTGEKVVAHMLSDGWSYADGHHFHECTRCHAHIDETECTRETVPGRAATCTLKGITDGVKCSVCGSAIVEQQEIPALGHDFGEAYVSISDTQHAHQCSRCGGYDTPVNHTYVNNICECGRKITVAEIWTIYEGMTLGDTNTNGTFSLTGKVKSIDIAYNAGYKNISLTLTVTEGDKTYDFYCFRISDNNGIIGSSIKVDDIISIIGCQITYFDGANEDTREVINAKFNEYEVATYNIVCKDKDGVTVNDLPSTAKRGDKVEFTITYDAEQYIVTVFVNGKEIGIVDGKYSFELETDTTISFELQDANVTHPHKISDINKATVSNSSSKLVSATGYANAESNYQNGGVTVNGVTFEYRTIITNSSKTTFQLNVTNTKNDDNPNAYMKIVVPNGTIKRFTLSGVTETARANIIVVGYDESGKEINLTAEADNDLTVINLGDNKLVAIKFTSSGALSVDSFDVTYGIEGECSNTTNFTEHPAQAPSCTEDGTIRYWTCDVCGSKFSDEKCNNMITNIVDPATGHKVGNLVEAQAPDCVTETNGHIAYYECEHCHKYFEDAEATKEITDITVAYKHTLVKVDKVFPTTETAGKEEYWKCSVDGCTACFEDEEGTVRIDDIANWGIIDPITEACTHETYEWKFNVDKSHCKVCSTCGVEFDACDGMFEGELFVEVESHNNGTHNFVCGACDCTLTDVNCVYDNNGVCILCGYNKNSEITVTLTVNDGLTGKITIGANELGESGTISLVKGTEVSITPSFGDVEITMTVTVDGTAITDGKFTPANDTHNIVITVSKKVNSVTVTQTTFTSVSGNLNGDTNVTYTSAKGGGTSAPAINGGEIRLYQNSNGTGGGTITISVPSGKKIISIEIGSSMATSIAYTIGSETNKSEKQSILENGKVILVNFGEDVTSVTIHCMGADKNSRLYVNYLSVTYA